MRRLLRSLRAREPLEPLELTIRDEPYAYLDHFCPNSEQHRLLGVAFAAEERELLRSGEACVLFLACDQCIWQRSVTFRLAAVNGARRG